MKSTFLRDIRDLIPQLRYDLAVATDQDRRSNLRRLISELTDFLGRDGLDRVDMIEAIIKKAGRPMRLMEIVAGVRDREFWYRGKAESLQQAICRTLHEHPEKFCRTRELHGRWHGRWTLANAAQGPRGGTPP
jgi:hypothetical protein